MNYPRSSSLVETSGWARPETRRVRAVKACHDFDSAALGELLIYYLVNEGRKGARVSEQTKRAYLSGMRALLNFAGPFDSPSAPLLKIDRETVKRFVVHEQLRGLAPESIRLHLAAIRCLFRALVWAGALAVSPAENVSAPPDSRNREDRRDAVPWDDYAKLRTVAAGETPLHKRNLAILYALGSLGMRVSEVAALNVRDIARGEARVLHGKGGKTRRLELTAKSEAALKEWVAVRTAAPGEEALFVNVGGRTRAALIGRRMSPEAIRGVLKRLLKEAGLPGHYSPHSLRHSHLSAFLEATGDLQLTAARAGHTSIETTTIYTKRSRAKMREAVAKLED